LGNEYLLGKKRFQSAENTERGEKKSNREKKSLGGKGEVEAPVKPRLHLLRGAIDLVVREKATAIQLGRVE